MVVGSIISLPITVVSQLVMHLHTTVKASAHAIIVVRRIHPQGETSEKAMGLKRRIPATSSRTDRRSTRSTRDILDWLDSAKLHSLDRTCLGWSALQHWLRAGVRRFV